MGRRRADRAPSTGFPFNPSPLVAPLLSSVTLGRVSSSRVSSSLWWERKSEGNVFLCGSETGCPRVGARGVLPALYPVKVLEVSPTDVWEPPQTSQSLFRPRSPSKNSSKCSAECIHQFLPPAVLLYMSRSWLGLFECTSVARCQAGGCLCKLISSMSSSKSLVCSLLDWSCEDESEDFTVLHVGATAGSLCGSS